MPPTLPAVVNYSALETKKCLPTFAMDCLTRITPISGPNGILDDSMAGGYAGFGEETWYEVFWPIASLGHEASLAERKEKAKLNDKRNEFNGSSPPVLVSRGFQRAGAKCNHVSRAWRAETSAGLVS